MPLAFMRSSMPARKIGPDDLERLCPDWREREAFLSGPGEMLDAMTAYWERHGDRSRLHMERFQPVIGGEAQGGEGGAISFLAPPFMMMGRGREFLRRTWRGCALFQKMPQQSGLRGTMIPIRQATLAGALPTTCGSTSPPD